MSSPNPLRATVTVHRVLNHSTNIFITSTKFRHSKHAKAQWVLMTQLNKAVVALSVGFFLMLCHLQVADVQAEVWYSPGIPLLHNVQSYKRIFCCFIHIHHPLMHVEIPPNYKVNFLHLGLAGAIHSSSSRSASVDKVGLLTIVETASNKPLF